MPVFFIICLLYTSSNYAGISNLEMALGDFLTDENNTYKEKVCVLGSNVAKTVFGSVYDAYDGTVCLLYTSRCV